MDTPLLHEWRGFRKHTVKRYRLIYQYLSEEDTLIICQLRGPGMR
jgi:mRNA-degrading endonuclease RelE of RelBE toxin-antitoxin system